MDKFPEAISSYVNSWLLEERATAFFLLDKSGIVKNAGGALDAYGMDTPPIGNDITDLFIFMEGILPLSDPDLRLPGINLSSTQTVEARIFHIDPGYALLILDDSRRSQKMAQLQQKANDLKLLRQKKTARMEKRLNAHAISSHYPDHNFDEESNNFEGSVLCVGIYGTLRGNDAWHGAKKYSDVKSVLCAITDPIHKQDGIVESATGSYVLALFGAFTSTRPAPVQALGAIESITKNIAILNSKPLNQERGHIHIGLSVATGRLSIMADIDDASTPMVVFGGCIHSAMEMVKKGPRNKVMIDLATYQAAGKYQTAFNKFHENTLGEPNAAPELFIGELLHV